MIKRTSQNSSKWKIAKAKTANSKTTSEEKNTKLLGNGAFQFAYTNSSGQGSMVYASTNLVDWASLGVATQISSGLYQFTDTAATNYPRRFYKLRTP